MVTFHDYVLIYHNIAFIMFIASPINNKPIFFVITHDLWSEHVIILSLGLSISQIQIQSRSLVPYLGLSYPCLTCSLLVPLKPATDQHCTTPCPVNLQTQSGPVSIIWTAERHSSSFAIYTETSLAEPVYDFSSGSRFASSTCNQSITVTAVKWMFNLQWHSYSIVYT